MKLTVVGWACDPELTDEEALLNRYATLTGWSEAVRAAGARHVTVVQRFHRDSVLTRDGVEYRFCRGAAGSPASAWAGARAIIAAVTNSRPDVVHVNGLGFPIQTWQLRQQLPASSALVVQDHASGAPRVNRRAWTATMRQAIRRRAMRAPDGYFFTSMAQAEPWASCGLIGNGQRVCAVIESSTRLAPVTIDEARRVTGLTGDPSILWVGRLNANKDPLCVIEAYARVRSTLPGATLSMIYSADDLLPEVKKHLARHPDLASRVRLLGGVSHEAMALFYSAADLFVLGSHHEGSGYALIEACACGVPPAVTDIPAFRALTADGAVGRLWPVGDARGCADAIVALARPAGPAQRAPVREHFQRSLSWPAVGRQALSAYELVLRDRRARLRVAAGREQRGA